MVYGLKITPGTKKIIRQFPGKFKPVPPVSRIQSSQKSDTFAYDPKEFKQPDVQWIFDEVLGKSDKKTLKSLEQIGFEKYYNIRWHKYYNPKIPDFNSDEFLETFENMSASEIKNTIEEITNLYKTLPKEDYKATLGVKDKEINLAKLTVLKFNNKTAYDYILNNPDKNEVSDLLKIFASRLNSSVFETLTIPQIRQISTSGVSIYPSIKSADISRGLAAEIAFVKNSDSLYLVSKRLNDLHKHLKAHTINEPFTAFRTEKDVGMFSKIPLNKNISYQVKWLLLKNIFKAKFLKVHEYNGSCTNYKISDLFANIMKSNRLSLADAMEVVKFGGDKFRRQVFDLIKQNPISDSRFKSLTFDRNFAKSWLDNSADNNAKIFHHITVEPNLHGKYSHVQNKQAEFILDNEEKTIRVKDIQYDKNRDIYCFNTVISKV